MNRRLMQNAPSEHDLGDGVYAKIELGVITLRMERAGSDHFVVLNANQLIKLIDLSMRARWLSPAAQ